jgi:hypothetical protein
MSMGFWRLFSLGTDISPRGCVQGCRVSRPAAASPYMRSGRSPECVMHEALPRRDATHLKRGGQLWHSKDENGRVPRIVVWRCCQRQFLFVALLLGFRPDLNTYRNHSSFDITPERDEQLACQGHDRDPSCPPRQSPDALAEPVCQSTARLVAKPEPGKLDHGRSCAGVAGAADAPIPVYSSTLGGGGDADVAGDLTPVVERPIEYLACEDGRKILSEPTDTSESGDLARVVVLLILSRIVAFGLNFADQLQDHYEPSTQAVQLGPKVARDLASISSAQHGKISLLMNEATAVSECLG